MPKIKPHLKDLHRINPEGQSRTGKLRLDMNECVPGLPESFVKEVLSAIDSEFLATYPEYYKTLQEKLAIHNNIHPENISLSNGSDAAIKYIFDAYVSSGEKILLTDPTFAMYPIYCKIFEAKPISVGYRADLSFPVREFMDRISPDIKLAVVVNPNNPTGTVAEENVLISIIERALDNDVLIIVDEAYFYFYPKTIIELVQKYKNLIVLRTFSKLCGMAAVRLGYAAACPEVIEDLRRVKPTYDVNALATLFAEKILDRTEVIPNLIKLINAGRQYLIQRLYEEGIDFKAGSANFVLIKCNGRVTEIIRRLSEENILVKGQFEQDFLKKYIRVTVGTEAIMKKFWKVFIKIWKTADKKEN